MELTNGCIPLFPGLIDRKLRGYRVKTIDPGKINPAIKTDHAVYVLEIPDSEDAPNQALDFRYYVRINGHNEPAPHRMIEDIRNRRRTPKIEAQFKLDRVRHQHEGFRTTLAFDLFIGAMNTGVVTAHDLSLSFTIPPKIQFEFNVEARATSYLSNKNARLLSTSLPDLHPKSSFELRLIRASMDLDREGDQISQLDSILGQSNFKAFLYRKDAQPLKIASDGKTVLKPLRTHLVRH